MNKDLGRGMSAVNATAPTEDFDDSHGATPFRRFGEKWPYNLENFHGLAVRGLSIPAHELSMIPARVQIHSHRPACLIYDCFGRRINSNAGMSRVPVLSIVHVDEPFAIHQTGKPAVLPVSAL